ncbi:hypothetical protein ACJ41O_002807 [Fusarium nematophilum]
MSNRFVSAGTIGSSGEISKDSNTTGVAPEQQPLHDSARSKEWEVVQQELEAERQRREEQRAKAASGEGEKSLYDILQANKAAKQAAFEEQTKLRNQFRALDDDEVEFLDEVRAAKRAEEERVRQETEEGLKTFRERQKGDSGEKHADEPEAQEAGESWGVGRKRKRAKDREVKGLRRKVSTTEEEEVSKHKDDGSVAEGEKDEKRREERRQQTETVSKTETTAKKGLGLVGYGSESDSEA